MLNFGGGSWIVYNTHPDHGGSSAGRYSGAKSDRRNNDYTPILSYSSIFGALGIYKISKIIKNGTSHP